MAVIFGIDTANLFKKKDAPESKADDAKGGLGKSLFNDKKLVIRLSIAGALILIVFGGYFLFISPSLKEQENKILEIDKWNQQLVSCGDAIEKLKTEVTNLNNQGYHKS